MQALFRAPRQHWPLARVALGSRQPGSREATFEQLRAYALHKPWRWPGRPIYFLCDVHADADALLRSLIACGAISRTAPGGKIALTPAGRDALWVVGGDCLNKGPNNLRVLSCLNELRQQGASMRLLTGNHELRTLMGLRYAGNAELRHRHLFARLGAKGVPLLHEVFCHMQKRGKLNPKAAAKLGPLFPDAQWLRLFPRAGASELGAERAAQEVLRVQRRALGLQRAWACRGLGHAELRLAVAAAREFFFDPQGAATWFFESLRLAHQEGSFLFIHAGVDDSVAEVLQRGGVRALNAWYDRLLRGDLCHLHDGPVGNSVRTQYRASDHPLTAHGVARLQAAGVLAIVHGHRTLGQGQRMVIRQGLLNVECDATLDCNSRFKHGLVGLGAAAVVFKPGGVVEAISSDYPYRRVCHLEAAAAGRPRVHD